MMYALLSAWFASMAAAASLGALPPCGNVVEDSSRALAQSSLWNLRGHLVEAKEGEIFATQLDGERIRLAFHRPDERLLFAFEFGAEIVLLTSHPRGYGQYFFVASSGQPPSLFHVKSADLEVRRNGRTLSSPLLDVWLNQSTGKIVLLSAFEIRLASILDFVAAEPLPFESVTALPTAYEAGNQRPVTFFPWEPSGYSFSPPELLVFTAPLAVDPDWEQNYSWRSDSGDLNMERSGIYPGSYFRNIRNRASAEVREWLVQDFTLIGEEGRTGSVYEEGYPYDAFQMGDQSLVTLYGYGTVFYSGEKAICQAFSGAVSSAVMYWQQTPTGKQRAFFGISQSGTLLKTVMYEN